MLPEAEVLRKRAWSPRSYVGACKLFKLQNSLCIQITGSRKEEIIIIVNDLVAVHSTHVIQNIIVIIITFQTRVAHV
jgi:hypothetical protein